jgi:hypothetical protein
MRRLSIAFTAVAAVAFAADAEFSVPVIGYVFDAQSEQIRPLMGTPGAALAASGISFAGSERALVANVGSFVLVSSSTSDSLTMLRRTGSTIESTAIPGIPSRFDTGALSSGSTAAILYSAECTCVRILSDLATEPKLSRSLALMDSTEVRGLAIDNRANVAAIAVAIHGESKLLIYTAESDTPSSELALPASALAFDGVGDKLLVADEKARAVYVVSDIDSTPGLEQILSEADGLRSPVAVGPGPNAEVIIADAEAGVHIWNPSDRTVRHLACACRVTTVQSTATSGMYRISGAESGSVWILQFDSDNVRTFFVPVPKSNETSKGEGTK